MSVRAMGAHRPVNSLSYVVLAGGAVLKLPQLLRLLRSNTADGISIPSHAIELVSMLLSASWGVSQRLHPTNYGENLFICSELLMIILIAARRQKRLHTVVPVVTAQLVAFALLCSGKVPTSVHKMLLSAHLLLIVSGKVPQIQLNYQNGHTGELSLLTYVLGFLGAAARVATTCTNIPWEKGKSMLLGQYVTATLLNLVIVGQILHSEMRRRRRAIKAD